MLGGCGKVDNEESSSSKATAPYEDTDDDMDAAVDAVLAKADEDIGGEAEECKKNYDVLLYTNNSEITIGTDDSEIIFSAQVGTESSPETVELVDADSGEVVAELYDEADYVKYGDSLKGDGVYNCRYTVNTDIDTDPETSQEAYYHYYARFYDADGEHISDTVEIFVLEQFTDKELEDMQAVDDALQQLMSDDDFKNGTVDERKVIVTELLNKLADEGTEDRPYSLVIKDSIYAGDETLTFEYTCHISSGVMLKEFDPMMN